MLILPPSVRIYLASEPVDMRRGIDGLLALVRERYEGDVFSGHLFVFIGKKADKLKALYWDHGGFVLVYKRLERGTFRRPLFEPGSESVVLEATELAMLLSGIDIKLVRRPNRWLPPACRILDTAPGP
jgi:transposase